MDQGMLKSLSSITLNGHWTKKVTSLGRQKCQLQKSRDSIKATMRRQITANWRKNQSIPKFRNYTTPTPSNIPTATPLTPIHVKDFIVPESSGTGDVSIENILISAGQISNDAFIPVSPETIAAHIWMMLEHDLGIPLWAAMALTTWGIRTAALPIFFAQVRNMAVLSLISPKIQQIKHKMAIQEQSGDEVMVKYWKERLTKLYKTFGASPWKNFVSSLVIIPLMVAQAFSARYMLTYTPHLLEQSGPLWLSDLTIADPLYITPCLYVGLQLLILRLNLPMQSGIIGNVKNVSKVSWALLACYSAALGFICTQFPAAISTLWLYSMSFTALSNAAMYFPWVRRRLEIATSLPVERPSHLPPKFENPVKAIVSKELTREMPANKPE